jgi:hypothetical protein
MGLSSPPIRPADGPGGKLKAPRGAISSTPSRPTSSGSTPTESILPAAYIADPRTPIEETLRAFDDLMRQGKMLYIGCSTLAAWQVVDARTATHFGPTVLSRQERYSLLDAG